MKNTIDKKGGLRKNFTTVLEYLDHAANIELLAGRHSDTQEKTYRLHDILETVELNINPSKTKTIHLNCKKSDLITASGDEVEDIEALINLGAVLDIQDITEADIKRRLALSRKACARL